MHELCAYSPGGMPPAFIFFAVKFRGDGGKYDSVGYYFVAVEYHFVAVLN